MNPTRILYMEDDAGAARLFQKTMARLGYQVDLARDGEAGLAAMQEAAYDLIVVDHHMPAYDGLEVIRRLAARGAFPPLIMITGGGDEKVAVEAMKLGASDYMVKEGAYLDLLPTVIGQVFRQRQLEAEREAALAALHERSRNLALLNRIGNALTATLELDAVLQRLLAGASELVSAPESAVWLYEEEGAGLRCVARLREGVTLDCAGQGVAEEAGLIARVAARGTSALEELNEGASDPDTLCSRLGVPLRARDQVIGVLEVCARHPGAFDEDTRALVETLGAQAASAIDNARLFAEVQRLAVTDALTGLRNRRSFFELAEREFDRAHRYNRPLVALMLDIDHFKRVNDTYGHAVGDEVLHAVAQYCQQNIREIDILGRYGGEEFAVILPETELPVAYQVAERLRESIALYRIPVTGGVLSVTASLGLSQATEATETLAEVIGRADAALYAAKQAGRNQVAIVPHERLLRA